MNIVASVIDYKSAKLDDREKFSFTKGEKACFYENIKEVDGVLGSVLISTCNRTELYLSLDENSNVDPFQLLCDGKDLNPNEYQELNNIYAGDAAIKHLFKLSSGTESQIWGDAQIVSQIRDSIGEARGEKASDSILNVMFRIAVSAGKRVKTLVDFKLNENSTALRAVNLIKDREDIEEVLIIGNGVIGRLVAELLVKAGKKPTMTLRQYKSGAISIPQGVKTINYSDRYEKMKECQAVVSATLSMHHTIEGNLVNILETKPKVFIDLAVPRDIDPMVDNIEGVVCYNIDDISKDIVDGSKEEQIKDIEEILFNFEDDFYKWYAFRKNIMEGK